MITTKARSKLVASGDADAQFRSGYRFAFCDDKRRRNLKRPFIMWKAAAEQGHVRARFYLGTCYDFGSGTRRNSKRAMFCIKKRPRPIMMSRSTTLLWGIETASAFRGRSASR
jgi:TPR repeat protein